MKLQRRAFVGSLAAGAVLGPALGAAGQFEGASTVSTDKIYDVVVVGAGAFGAWTAYHLQQRGKKVVLLDAYGPGNSRASSGGESRIIRMGYGADEIYTRWSMRSLSMWQDFAKKVGLPLFQRLGVLWTAREGDPYLTNSRKTLEKAGVRFEFLSRSELQKRYPQMVFEPKSWGIYEPESGALTARRAVQTVVREAVAAGADYLPEAVRTPSGKGKLTSISTQAGTTIRAGSFIFACGPWLPKVFPEVLKGRIHPTRQEVFFFGPAPGDRRFAPPAMPIWIDMNDEIYSFPDFENRGFKIASDSHGPAFDPDTGNRVVTEEGLRAIRKYVARRFPGLADAPVVETRVCQYENTSNGDFLIDRHPAFENVWLVGGGSGHGFKHGPAVGEYVAARIIEGGPVEPRFTLAAKQTVPQRAVF